MCMNGMYIYIYIYTRKWNTPPLPYLLPTCIPIRCCHGFWLLWKRHTWLTVFLQDLLINPELLVRKTINSVVYPIFTTTHKCQSFNRIIIHTRLPSQFSNLHSVVSPRKQTTKVSKTFAIDGDSVRHCHWNKQKRTTLRIPMWSPTIVLTEPEDA